MSDLRCLVSETMGQMLGSPEKDALSPPIASVPPGAFLWVPRVFERGDDARPKARTGAPVDELESRS
jgi:hypothetical protein